MQHFAWLIVLPLLFSGSLARAAEKDKAGVGQILFQNVCLQCHGPRGEGNAQIKSPSITGLPDWYIRAQVENFRADRRGAHTGDIEGQLMRAISKVLNPQQVSEVAVYVSKLPRMAPQPTWRADVAIGRELFEERCMECHRYNGEGELAFGAAPLVGLQDWYLASQLKKFRTGQRGALKDDANGQKMVFASGFIDSEDTLRSVVAYLMTLQDQNEKKAADVVFGK